MRLTDRAVTLVRTYGIHAAFPIAIGFAIGGGWPQADEAGSVSQLVSSVAALGGLWIAFYGIQRQREESARQQENFALEIAAARESAQAATRAVAVSELRLWRERRDRLARLAAQCDDAVREVGAVRAHPQLSAASGRGTPLTGADAGAWDVAALPTVLRLCGAALSAALPGSGELPSRDIESIAAATVRLSAAGASLALAGNEAAESMDARSIAVIEAKVASMLDAMIFDLRSAATSAHRLVDQMEQARPGDSD